MFLPWRLIKICCILLVISIILTLLGIRLKQDSTTLSASGLVVSGVNTEDKVVSITFDDGPDPLYTPQIMELLKRYHARSTFFVIGLHARQYPDLLREIQKNGHEIGNHSYHHRRYIGQSKDYILQDIKMNEDLIEKYCGVKPVFLRPPGGRCTDTLLDIARANHLTIINWGQDPEDWRNKNSLRISRQILANIRPGQIIVLHDGGGDRSQTVKAVEQVLSSLSDQGYHFVPVGELLREGK
ncbi:MAG: polysaccharide deacetylase family protein [Chitinophagales bacterium]